MSREYLRKCISGAKAAAHGGPDCEELRRMGIADDQVLDFSSNLNPYGASRLVEEAMRNVSISCYPDRHCVALREALAAANGLEADNVLPGNGASELIHLIARAAQGPVLIAAPTFGEYRHADELAGLTVQEVMAESPNLAFSVDILRRAIHRQRPSVVFLCNPNNPSGHYLALEEVGVILHTTRSVGGLLVLDEAYVDFVPDRWDSVGALGLQGLVILRSLTKLYGLAGLRLGYILAKPDLVRALSTVQPPWSVNAFAQAAGIAAMADKAHLESSRRALLIERARLESAIENLGYRTLPTHTAFFLVRVGNAKRMRERLLAHNLLVRDCSSFGLPNHIRISARTPEDGARLIQAMASESTSGNASVDAEQAPGTKH